MNKIQKAIVVFASIAIIFVGYSAFSDDRPIRCFEGFKYRVGSDGALHRITFGKFGNSVRCDS